MRACVCVYVCTCSQSDVAQKPITAAPAPATPVTLQKKGVTVGRSQAGGEGKASDSDDMVAEQEMTEDGGGAGGGAASGGYAPSSIERGEM